MELRRRLLTLVLFNCLIRLHTLYVFILVILVVLVERLRLLQEAMLHDPIPQRLPARRFTPFEQMQMSEDLISAIVDDVCPPVRIVE